MSLSPLASEHDLSLAEAFIDALARRDFSQLQALFDPQVRFRALIPSGLRAAGDAAGAIRYLSR